MIADAEHQFLDTVPPEYLDMALQQRFAAKPEQYLWWVFGYRWSQPSADPSSQHDCLHHCFLTKVIAHSEKNGRSGRWQRRKTFWFPCRFGAHRFGKIHSNYQTILGWRRAGGGVIGPRLGNMGAEE
jgi:hypothetical protein